MLPSRFAGGWFFLVITEKGLQTFKLEWLAKWWSYKVTCFLSNKDLKSHKGNFFFFFFKAEIQESPCFWRPHCLLSEIVVNVKLCLSILGELLKVWGGTTALESSGASHAGPSYHAVQTVSVSNSAPGDCHTHQGALAGECFLHLAGPGT